MSYVSRPHSLVLRNTLLDMITMAEGGDSNVELEDRFVHEDNGEQLPIPVFSSVTPRSPVPFLLHVMLICGKFETELDLRMNGSLRGSLAAAKLIGKILTIPKRSSVTRTTSSYWSLQMCCRCSRCPSVIWTSSLCSRCKSSMRSWFGTKFQ